MFLNEEISYFSFSLSLLIDTYEPDGYNPEAPSITSTGRSQYRQFFSRTPMQRPNLIGLTSGEMDTNPRGMISYIENIEDLEYCDRL